MAEVQFDFEKSLKAVRSYPFIHKYLPIDRYVVRPIAALFVRAFFRTNFSPFVIIFISLFVGLVGSIAFAIGSRTSIALGGGLIFLQVVVGTSGGMLARAKSLSSRFGFYSEQFYSKICVLLIMLGITLGYYRSNHEDHIVILGISTIVLYYFGLSLYYIMSFYMRREITGELHELTSLYTTIVFIFSLINHLGLLIIIGFAMTVGGAVATIIKFIQLGRQTNEGQFEKPM